MDGPKAPGVSMAEKGEQLRKIGQKQVSSGYEHSPFQIIRYPTWSNN